MLNLTFLAYFCNFQQGFKIFINDAIHALPPHDIMHQTRIYTNTHFILSLDFKSLFKVFFFLLLSLLDVASFFFIFSNTFLLFFSIKITTYHLR